MTRFNNGLKGNTGASITSAAFSGTDIIFTKNDTSTVTLEDATVALKGDKGDTGSAVPVDDASTAADRVLSAHYIKGQLSAIDDYKRPRYLTKPTGFTFSKTVNIQETSVGDFVISPSIDQIYPNSKTLKTYYVDNVNGNDSNSGLAMDVALKSIATAWGKSDVETIILKPDNYGSANNGNSYFLPDKNIRIISQGGKSIWFQGFCGSERSWTDLTGGVYLNTSTLVPLIVHDCTVKDEDYNYHYSQYTVAGDLATCEATAGSFWKNTVTNAIYIHTIDGREPDRDILINSTATGWALSITQAITTTNRFYHLENIMFIGGIGCSSTAAAEKITITAKGCEFSFIGSGTQNCFSSLGNTFTYLVDCIAEGGVADGFNYHGSGALNPEAIEVNCVGRNNGIGSGSNINNGSTVHEGVAIVRVNGHYHGNEGPNVADANESMSWNIGCYAHDSVATADASKIDFSVYNTAKMWLYRCNAYGDSVVNLNQADTSTLYNRESNYDDTSGTVTSY
jgi:hypothetical protein